MSRYNVELLTADVLLFEARGPVGRAIVARTGGIHSHAELVLVGWGRRWACGASKDGVTLRPVSSLLLTGEHIEVRRLVATPDALPGWRDFLADCAIEAVGVWGYAHAHLLANALPRSFFPQTDPTRLELGGRPDVMCSEFVSLLLRRFARVDPSPIWADRWTTPFDLAGSTALVTVTPLLALAPDA